MNIKWILGMGSMGVVAFFALTVHDRSNAGGYETQKIMAACGGHAAGVACHEHAKDNPRAPAVAAAKAGDAGVVAKDKDAKDKALKPQTTCPVMKGAAINPDLYVDHEGKRIYVCCPGCVDRVKADPEAALEKLRKQGVAPAKAGGEPAAAEEQEKHHHHHH